MAEAILIMTSLYSRLKIIILRAWEVDVYILIVWVLFIYIQTCPHFALKITIFHAAVATVCTLLAATAGTQIRQYSTLKTTLFYAARVIAYASTIALTIIQLCPDFILEIILSFVVQTVIVYISLALPMHTQIRQYSLLGTVLLVV